MTMPEKLPPNTVFRDFMKTFLVPVLLNKAFMIYFGLNYSQYPGEGYGYGLIVSILFFVASCARFVWKYRDNEDP